MAVERSRAEATTTTDRRFGSWGRASNGYEIVGDRPAPSSILKILLVLILCLATVRSMFGLAALLRRKQATTPALSHRAETETPPVLIAGMPDAVRSQRPGPVPDCVWYGADDGLFEPGTPHPRYIVTGGAGFIGSNLVHRLMQDLQPGQVKVIDSLESGTLRNLRSETSPGGYVIRPTRDFCAADLRDPTVAQQLLRGADLVYHLAASPTSQATDTILHANVIQAAKANGIGKFIHVGPYRLDSDTQQRLMLAPTGEFGVGIVRLTSVYGRRMEIRRPDAHLIAALIRDALRTSDEAVVAVVADSPRHLRDFVHVDDVVEGLLRMATLGIGQGPVDLGAGPTVFTADVAQIVVALAQVRLRRSVSVAYGRSCRAVSSVPDRAGQLLGWSPTVALADGIADLFTWMQTELSAT